MECKFTLTLHIAKLSGHTHTLKLLSRLCMMGELGGEATMMKKMIREQNPSPSPL